MHTPIEASRTRNVAAPFSIQVCHSALNMSMTSRPCFEVLGPLKLQATYLGTWPKDTVKQFWGCKLGISREQSSAEGGKRSAEHGGGRQRFAPEGGRGLKGAVSLAPVDQKAGMLIISHLPNIFFPQPLPRCVLFV